MKNKTKLFGLLAVILVVFNIGLLIFIFTNQSDRPHPNRNRNIIIEKLKFDKTQVVQYDSLIKIHRSGMQPAKRRIMELKNELYAHLNQSYNKQLNDSLIQEINLVQKQLEFIHIKHFYDIKTICKTEQLIAYKELTNELAQLFTSPLPTKSNK